jgi:hypothetical protein
MVLRSRLLFALGAILSAGAIVAACGSTGDSGGGGTCVPGTTQTCACVGGAMGAQACNTDGKSFGMCQCSANTGSGGSPSTGTLTGAGGGKSCECTDPSSELYCGVAACTVDGGTTTTTGTGGSTPIDAGVCVGHITFAGKAPTQLTSIWKYTPTGTTVAVTGTPGGDAMCKDMGADHVCDYDDLVDAAAAGELSALAATDNAWLLRYHNITVAAGATNLESLGAAPAAGTVIKVGAGSRCADWTYGTDHLNDGEFVTFEKGGNSPTFHLDDNPCAIQTVPKDIPCGHNGTPHTILCCFPKCKTVPEDTCTCNATTNTCM